MQIKEIISSLKDRSLFAKARYKIKYSVLLFLVRSSLFINCPRLTGLVFAAMSYNINKTGEFSVLCLGRSIFLDDVEALARFGQRIKYIVILKDHFRIILNHFLTDSDKKQLTVENYHTHHFADGAKLKYNLYLKQMMPVLRRFIKFDAVLSGNFGYLEQQELEAICTESGIPFIILHKEGLLVPGYTKEWAGLIGTWKFRGAGVLFYSDEIKKIFLSSDLAGLSESNTKVVGMPRFDYHFAAPQKQQAGFSSQVVCFSSDPDDRLRGLFIRDEDKIKKIKDRFYDFHKSVIEFASKNRDIKVIIKTKFAEHYFQYVKQILADNFAEPIDNLVVTNMGNPLDMIKNSRAVISFNSTTCLEALILGKVLISPYFGDLIPDKPWDYFSECSNLVNYAKTELDMERYILHPEAYVSRDQDSKKKLFQNLLGNADGKASVRAENEIIATIRQFQHKT